MKPWGHLSKTHRRTDRAVSPVIGVVLMVAVTVVIAAGVAVWVRAVADHDDRLGVVSVRLSSGDGDGDGRADHIKVQLVRADDAPFAFSTARQEVGIEGFAAGGNFSIGHHGATASLVCTRPPTTVSGTAMCGASNAFAFGAFGGADKADTTWDVGQVLFAPCYGDAVHTVVVRIQGQVVHQGTVRCGEATGT